MHRELLSLAALGVDEFIGDPSTWGAEWAPEYARDDERRWLACLIVGASVSAAMEDDHRPNAAFSLQSWSRPPRLPPERAPFVRQSAKSQGGFRRSWAG